MTLSFRYLVYAIIVMFSGPELDRVYHLVPGTFGYQFFILYAFSVCILLTTAIIGVLDA